MINLLRDKSVLVSFVLFALVYIADVRAVLGAAAGVAYVGSIFPLLLSHKKYDVFIGAGIATLLITLGYIFSPQSVDAGNSLAYRGISIAAVWVFAVLIHLIKSAQRKNEFAAKYAKSVLDTVVDGVVTIDAKGNIETINRAVEIIFGYSADEVVGKNVKILMPNQYAHNHDSYIKNYLSTRESKVIGKGREFVGLRSNGSTFPMELAIDEMEFDGEKKFTGIVRDITDRKAAESDREQFQSTLDHTQDCIFMFTADTLKFFYVNDGAMKQIGRSFEEACLITPVDIKPQFNEEEFRQLIQPLIDGPERATTLETIHASKDGTLRPVEIFLQYVASDETSPRFVAIVRDITERQRVDKAKSEFVSTVSHELRTPLSSIRGSLGLVKSGVYGQLPEKVERMVGLAEKNASRLVLLVNDLLDMEQLQSGKMTFNKKMCDLKTVVAQSIETNAPYAESYGVKIECGKCEMVAPVFVDEERVAQVMANLLSNAVKFSPSGDKVLVNMSDEGKYYRVSVTDSGQGIDDEFKKRIFQRFSQADASDTKSKGGTGLGLNISKAIVDQMDGEIGFASETGKGTCFYFDLPKVDLTENSEILITSKNKVGENDLPKVLLVEDEKDYSEIISSILDGMADVTIASSLNAAKELLEMTQWDLVIIDIFLPDGNGIDLIPIIDRQLNRKTPKLILSANEVDEEVAKRVDLAVVKGQIENDELMTAIKSLIG